MATFNVSVQVVAESAEDAEAILYNTLVDTGIEAFVGAAEEV